MNRLQRRQGARRMANNPTTALAHHVPEGNLVHKALNAGPVVFGTKVPWSTITTTATTIFFAAKCAKLEKKASKRKKRKSTKKKSGSRSVTFSKRK